MKKLKNINQVMCSFSSANEEIYALSKAEVKSLMALHNFANDYDALKHNLLTAVDNHQFTDDIRDEIDELQKTFTNQIISQIPSLLLLNQ